MGLFKDSRVLLRLSSLLDDQEEHAFRDQVGALFIGRLHLFITFLSPFLFFHELFKIFDFGQPLFKKPTKIKKVPLTKNIRRSLKATTNQKLTKTPSFLLTTPQ